MDFLRGGCELVEVPIWWGVGVGFAEALDVERDGVIFCIIFFAVERPGKSGLAATVFVPTGWPRTEAASFFCESSCSIGRSGGRLVLEDVRLAGELAD